MSDSTREALAEISQRARFIVEELARHTRERSEAQASASGRPANGPSWRGVSAGQGAEQGPPAELHQRLNELRACVGEVADVLEATVERLETVEIQLGDPDAGIERQLGEGIVRCESLLMGIEHRIVTRARPVAAGESAGGGESVDDPGTVLVLSRSSRRRSDLCLALERQGLRTVAAADLALAVKAAARAMPAVAVLEMPDHDDSAWLEDWKEHEEQGTLPCAVLLDFADEAAARTQGFETVRKAHGEAAMAASLTRIARERANRKPGE